MIAGLTSDDDPAAQRFAWEALATVREIDPAAGVHPDWSRGLASPLRRVRAAAIAVARGVGQASYRDFLSRSRIAADAWPLRMAQLWIRLPDTSDAHPTVFPPDQWSVCLEAFAAADADVATRLEAVRLMQRGLGDLHLKEDQAEVYCGYVGNATSALPPTEREQLVRTLVPAFPSGDNELDRELARLLGMLSADQPGLLASIARKWTAASTVEDDIHYLIVASLLPGPRSQEFTTATSDCLLSLHHKLDAAGQFASRNWPFRVAEACDELCRRDPALAEVLAASPRLNHVEHALLVERLPTAYKRSAARRLWTATVEVGKEPTSELVQLIGQMPPEMAFPLLRPLWDDGALRDAITLVLAGHPASEDRAKFVEVLASPQPAVVQRAARALVCFGARATPAEMAAALRALKQACSLEKQAEPRESLVWLLDMWTEDGADVELFTDPERTWADWYQVFSDYYPAEAARLQSSSGADAASWQRRLAAVDWPAGDATRGRKVFELRSCHRCHQVNGHLGPELSGVARRMSRGDLFTAILDPNLEVSPTYMTTLIATNSGEVYHGLVVYESPESTLLQTGPDTTVRITNAETDSMRKSTQSLMPTGLLDTLSDQDLSDLYAYLKSLASK